MAWATTFKIPKLYGAPHPCRSGHLPPRLKNRLREHFSSKLPDEMPRWLYNEVNVMRYVFGSPMPTAAQNVIDTTIPNISVTIPGRGVTSYTLAGDHT